MASLIKNIKRYILLPATDVQANNDTNPAVEKILVDYQEMLPPKLPYASGLAAGLLRTKKPIEVNVVRSLHENGAKLVTIKEEQLADFRFSSRDFASSRKLF